MYANVISLRELDIASDVCIIMVSDTDGVNSSVMVVGDCDASSVVTNPMSSSIVSDVSLNAASVITASEKQIKIGTNLNFKFPYESVEYGNSMK